MSNDLYNASKWYERLSQFENVSPDELIRYGHVLKSLKLYGKAKTIYEKYALVNPVVGNHYAVSCDYALNGVKANPTYEITNAYFNTSQSDFGVTLWDGKIVYTSFRTDMAKTRRTSLDNAVTGKSEIYVIDPNDQSVDASFLFDDLNDHSAMGPLAFAGNGNSVAVTRNNFDTRYKTFNPKTNKLSIYLSDVEETGKWTELRPFPFNDNAYSVGYPWLSADGQVMFFASDMKGGYGGYDLYVSQKDGGAWTTPPKFGT